MTEPLASGTWAPLCVFLGAGAGALFRWSLANWLNQPAPGWPWGTLVANLLGGAMVGLTMHVLTQVCWPNADAQALKLTRLLLVTGFLGGLTTFSTFSAEVIDLAAQGRWSGALAWALAHLLGSLALTGLGWKLAVAVLPGRV